MRKKSTGSKVLSAVFLMATSAIGPGFITQTATFTKTLGAAFAFAILLSIVVDIVVQQNIWRIVTLTGRQASILANESIKGSGYLLAILIIFGGLIFNVGNIAGTGLGLHALTGLHPKIGGALSASLALYIFSTKKASSAIDRLVVGLGLLMIILTLYVMFKGSPPYLGALKESVFPSTINFAAITTIIGGTVGGYICYAGAHNLLDKGMSGKKHVKEVGRAATNAILIVGLMRCILFLAILGVVNAGVDLDLTSKVANPAAQAFLYVAGEVGLKIFGLILWAAAITSVIGAAYTSMSFLPTFKKDMSLRQRNVATLYFTCISLLIYLLMGTAPTGLLVFAGGFNGLILPLGLSIFIYIGFKRGDLMEGYKYPRWLLYSGILVAALTWYMAIVSVGSIFNYLK